MNARDDGTRASLAACQKAAIQPTPVAAAIRIVEGAARSLNELHGAISPETVFLGRDGRVGLLGPSGGEPSSVERVGYLAPEQVSGGEVDRRADVYAFGVILWELLTGTRLFERGTATETRIAICEDMVLDVRDVNPDVPMAVGEVVRTALERAAAARFGTTTAFCNALANARSSSGIPDGGDVDVAKWVAECLPPLQSRPGSTPRFDLPAPSLVATPAAAVPDLDVRGASRTTRSQSSMEAVRVPTPAAAAVPAALAAVPTLDLPIPPPRTAPSSPNLSGTSGTSGAPPSSGKPSSQRIVSAAPAPSLDSGAGRTISFDTDDDDDFDMQIERNVAGTSLPTATSSHGAAGKAGSGFHTATATGRGRPGGTGLELGAASRMAREGRSADEHDGPSVLERIGGYAIAAVVMAGTVFALLKLVHRAGGRDVTRYAPHAFDGTSAPESGGLALFCIVVAVAIGFIGFRLKPHAWALVASGGAMLLLALAMVTVTLASTGENPTPPDGVLLVPYLLPTAILFLGLGIGGRAARLFFDWRMSRKIGSVPLAAIAAVVVFFAYEISRFAR
jgi:hypothetical protein